MRNQQKRLGFITGICLLLGAVPALLDGWRLFGDQVPAWIPVLSIGFKGAALTAIWTY